MELLKYSSNMGSELNEARRLLWSAKYMLGEANRQPDVFDKSYWMGRINQHRTELRNLAHKIRAEQLAQYEAFKVSIKGEATESNVFVKAVDCTHAVAKARRDYSGFAVSLCA